MASRHGAERPVLGREVVEHEERVADPEALRVRQRAHVAVERLRGGVSRQRRARVQAAELETRAEHVRDELEHDRLEQAVDEDVALVREVREPGRAGLPSELRARALALLREERVDPAHEPLAALRSEHALEPREAAIVQLPKRRGRGRHARMVRVFQEIRLCVMVEFRHAAPNPLLHCRRRARDGGSLTRSAARSWNARRSRPARRDRQRRERQGRHRPHEERLRDPGGQEGAEAHDVRLRRRPAAQAGRDDGFGHRSGRSGAGPGASRRGTRRGQGRRRNAGPPPRDRDRRPPHRARQHRVREGLAAAAGRRLPRPRRLDRDRHHQRSSRQPAAEHERREPQADDRPAQLPAAPDAARRRLADDPRPGGADPARRRRRAAPGRTQDDRGARQRPERADSARGDRGDRRRDPGGLQSRRGGGRAGSPAPGALDPQRRAALLGRDAPHARGRHARPRPAARPQALPAGLGRLPGRHRHERGAHQGPARDHRRGHALRHGRLRDRQPRARRQRRRCRHGPGRGVGPRTSDDGGPHHDAALPRHARVRLGRHRRLPGLRHERVRHGRQEDAGGERQLLPDGLRAREPQARRQVPQDRGQGGAPRRLRRAHACRLPRARRQQALGEDRGGASGAGDPRPERAGSTRPRRARSSTPRAPRRRCR